MLSQYKNLGKTNFHSQTELESVRNAKIPEYFQYNIFIDFHVYIKY